MDMMNGDPKKRKEDIVWGIAILVSVLVVVMALPLLLIIVFIDFLTGNDEAYKQINRRNENARNRY